MDSAITCPVCGEANPENSEFCRNCRQPLEARSSTGPSKNPASDAEPPIPEWLREARQRALRSSEDGAADNESPQQESQAGRAEDLLAGLASQTEGDEDETPAWVARITSKGAGARTPRAEQPFGQLDVPSEDEANGASLQPAAATEPDEMTAWFKEASAPAPRMPDPQVAKGGRDEAESGVVEASRTNDEIYDWLKKLDASAALASGGGEADSENQADVPDWVRSLGSAPSEPAEPETQSSAESVPDWLKESDGMQGSSGRSADSVEPAASAEWTSAAQPGTAFEEERHDGAAASVMQKELESPQVGRSTSAFTPEGMDGIDVDAIFASMEMPDWLSDVRAAEQTTPEPLPPAAQDAEPIAPAELPSWVQAMRPLESALPSQAPAQADERLEERGPLLGLHGVLPVIAGATAPTSKPKAHSIKLDASPAQQAHAELLDGIIQAETMPIPMKGVAAQGSQRLLRWAISAVLLLILVGAVFSGSKIIPLPAAVPNETIRAIQAVEAIPAGAPVLVVFDYEPATVGEMEATGASLLDHMLLLKHPRLAMLSTSPTGALLGDRFISTTLAARAYRSDAQYANLGYLPGGLAGAHFFAQDPRAAMPLGANGRRAWDSPALVGVTRLSDFKAIIVLTDSLEAGRVWIEQTASTRETTGMILVASAQAGPMLLPYADSGQVSGLVAGIRGAAGAEQANGGLPGLVRRYWDGYSLGLYTAALWIILGGARYFWIGLQERRVQAA